VNRLLKRGNDPFDNQYVPLIFSYHGRQVFRPSTEIDHEDPESADANDRGHFNRLHLPAAYPVPGGEGLFADPRRLRAAGIDDGDSGTEQMDQQPGKDAYHQGNPAAIMPSIGVLAATA